LDGLDELDWPEGVKDMQRNWIGRSTGAEVDFIIDGTERKLRVYTTRPDTLFGATYMVVAPEHELVDEITTPDQLAAVKAYIRNAALKSDLDRTDLAKGKSGVFTGRYAINPINGSKIQIWVADYVLMGYGTGAIMAVPAHDTRDFEFAQTFNIPIICILDPKNASEELRAKVLIGEACWTEDGTYINSSNKEIGIDINGLSKEEGIRTVTSWLESNGLGQPTINYKLRDWLFSRQRYWGEPFPVIHWEDGEVTVLEESELPLPLPEVEKYMPGETGESPLSNAGDWLVVTDKNGRKGRRETNTMPQWAGSCWYYLRFTDPTNNEEPFSKIAENYWMPVDLYVGGAEHAVLHLLYSRFWHKVLFDLGIVSTNEPFQKLFNQGMILAFAYETASGSKVPSDQVEDREGKFFSLVTGEELRQIVAKMSKSLKNVVNPDDVVVNYGADSLRLFEMFIGPLDATKPWTENGVKGVYNFLRRVVAFFGEQVNIAEGEESKDTLKILHQTIRKVSDDIRDLKFNTAISQMMVFTNHCYKAGQVNHETAVTFFQLLAPFAPHVSEELWEQYGNTSVLSFHPWPVFNEAYLTEDSFEYPVSFNGKVRFKIALPVDLPSSEIEKAVLAHDHTNKWIEGKAIAKIIIVTNKIINIVVK
jgi:leucyl-tRNA synthetase